MMFRRDEQVGFRRGRSCTEQVFTLWNICQLRVNNSVYQKPIAEENSDVIAAHCNDHILHNCAKNALKVLSFNMENLVLSLF